MFDSLPEQTGKELHDSKLRWLCEKHGAGLGYAYPRDFKSMYQEMQDTLKQVQDEGVIPILHFKMHGCNEGLELESGEIMPWGILGYWFRAINYASKNRLMVTLAACYGIEAWVQVIPLLNAPFRLLIAPVGRVSFGLLEEGFDAFYDTAFEGGIVKAVQAINNYRDDTGFAYLDPAVLFYRAVTDYKNEYDTPDKVNQLIDYLVEVKFLVMGDSEYQQTLRANWIRFLCGDLCNDDNATWLVYRTYMVALEYPDEGPEKMFLVNESSYPRPGVDEG